MDRDLKWQDLYRENKGKIDEQFGFHGLPHRAAGKHRRDGCQSSHRRHGFAHDGVGRIRPPQPDRARAIQIGWGDDAGNEGLYPSSYRLISVRPWRLPPSQRRPNPQLKVSITDTPKQRYGDRLWTGWVLPASDADIWFASGSAAYYQDLDSKDLSQAMAVHWARYRSLSISAPDPKQQFELETQKGALFLDQLRRDIGDNRFFKLMSDFFFAAHKARAVTAQSFLDAAGAKFALPADPGGPMYVLSDLRERFGSTLIVYGTLSEAGANRYAAEELQKRFYRALETQASVRKDFEVSEADLRTHDIVFVGRPETNSALAAFHAELGLDYSGATFRIAGN